MAISQSTARKRVSNARAILRERWNEYDGVAEDSSSSLAADVEGTSADELSVGEPVSGKLDEAKRNPARVNPAELRPKEELQRPFLSLPRGEQSQRPKLGSLCVSPEPGLKSKLRSSKLALVPRPQAVGAILVGLTQKNVFLSLRATAKQSQTSNFRQPWVSPGIKNRYQFELPGRWVWCYFASGQIGRGKKRLIGKGRSVFSRTQLLSLPFRGPWVPVPSSLPTEKIALLSGKWPCRSP